MDYFYSILSKMNEAVQSLVDKGDINSSSKIVILGLDDYAFALKFLLDRNGMDTYAYVSDDADKRARIIRSIKIVMEKYVNKPAVPTKVFSVDELAGELDGYSVILYASDCFKEMEKIKHIYAQYKIKIHCIYNWENNELKKITAGLRRMSLEEIKETEKNILVFFDAFCEKHQLRYWLSGGSMLGAIRHKGFIPWDDDIDVFMPDVDYERFLDLFEEDENYRCQMIDDENDVWGHYKFVRIADKKTLLIEKYEFYSHIIGVNLEILPIVGLPDEETERIDYIRIYDKMNMRRKELFFQCCGNMEKFRRIWNSECPHIDMYKFDDSKYVGVLGTGYYEKDCTRHSVYEKTLRLPFEDIIANIPQGYQEYLDNLYGKGWEEWPPEEDRVFKHNIEAYWL